MLLRLFVGFCLIGFGRWHGGSVVTAIVIVMTNVGYCSCCVCFFLVIFWFVVGVVVPLFLGFYVFYYYG